MNILILRDAVIFAKLPRGLCNYISAVSTVSNNNLSNDNIYFRRNVTAIIQLYRFSQALSDS